MTTPRGPHPAPARLRSAVTLWSLELFHVSSPNRRRFLRPRPPRDQGPGSSCDPCCVPVASTRSPFPLIEFFHPLQPFRSYRKLPYHCGCTAQAETPTTPARENMVVNGPAEGRSDRPHCACARASPRPLLSRFLFQPRFLGPNRHNIASIRGPAYLGPTFFRLLAGICSAHRSIQFRFRLTGR